MKKKRTLTYALDTALLLAVMVPVIMIFACWIWG
jgi:hypothetical protein